MSASASWTTREFAEAVDGIASAALRAAATLRIADHLGDTNLTLDELAGLTGTQPDRLGRMLEVPHLPRSFLDPRRRHAKDIREYDAIAPPAIRSSCRFT